MPGTVSGIKAGRAFVLIEAVDKTGAVLNGIRNRLGKWASQMSSLGTTLALRSAAALTPTVMATKAFSDFDDMMRRIESRTPGTADQMAAIRDQAKMLAQSMGAFSATEVGGLQEVLAVRGFDRGQILQSTEAILRLARAAGEGKDLMNDATIAAQAVAGSLASYGLKADSAAGFADALSVAANASNYTLEELVTSLSYAAPAAAEFGVSLKDTLSVLAAMRDLNIDASIAGTAFRNMMKYASQSKEQDKFNEKLEKLTGNVINFTDASKNLRDPISLLLAIAKATEGLGTAQRSELYSDLFETRASTPAAAVGKSIESIARMQVALDNAGGEAKRISEFMESGAGGAFRRFRAAVLNAAIALGEALSNSLITVTNYLTVATREFTSWINANAGYITLAAIVTAAMGALGIALIVVGQAMMALAATISVITFFTGAAATAMTLVTTLLSMPITLGLVATAVMNLRGVATQAFTDITGKVKELMSYLSEIGPLIAESLKMGDLETSMQLIVIAIKKLWLELFSSMAKMADDSGLNAILDQIMLAYNAWKDMFKSDPNAPLQQHEPRSDREQNLILYKMWDSFLRSTGGSDITGERAKYIKEQEDLIAKEKAGTAPKEDNFIDAFADTMKGMREEFDNARKAAEEARKADMEALDAEAALIKERMDTAKELNEGIKEIEDYNAMLKDIDAAWDKAEQSRKLRAGAADLVGVGKGNLAVAVGPKALEGLTKGSMEAAKQFTESAFDDRYGDLLESISESTRRTADNTEDMGAEGV